MNKLTKMLSRIKERILSLTKNEYLLSLQSYFKERRVTSYLFISTTLLAFTLLAIIINYYTYRNPKTHIRLELYSLRIVDASDTELISPPENNVMPDDFRIKDITVYADYSGNGKDEINVQVDFEGNVANIEDGGFIITTPKKFQREKEFFDSSMTRFTTINRGGGTYYYYKFDKSKDSFSISETFIGNVFERNAADLYFRFSIDAIGNPDAYRNIPVTIEIRNLSGLDIGSISPDPSEKNLYVVSYKYKSLEDLNRIGDIEIIASDKKRIYSDQFKMLFLGTILGIFISITTEILLDAISFVENRYKSVLASHSSNSEVPSNYPEQTNENQNVSTLPNIIKKSNGFKLIENILIVFFFLVEVLNSFKKRE